MKLSIVKAEQLPYVAGEQADCAGFRFACLEHLEGQRTRGGARVRVRVGLRRLAAPGLHLVPLELHHLRLRSHKASETCAYTWTWRRTRPKCLTVLCSYMWPANQSAAAEWSASACPRM